ncbi:MAG: indole-3-glycerol phosphate synthase TrpC [Proteobacteria bacterium]|nr:indole-3-glycerol phosphate synthase TrpC [Pseudomonadota bacterium]
MTFLEKVLNEKRELVKALKGKMPLEELKKMTYGIEKRSFFKTFSQRFPKEVKVIAEVKKASPSKGVLACDLDLPGLLMDYEKGGASAISVITEETYFNGSIAYIPEAKMITDLPILRKDFVVDEYDIYQAKAAGADAVLLIGEALSAHQIAEYLEIARQLDIDVLLEVHSLKTYEKIADLEGFILGINNRNLETLKVDLAVSHEVINGIPANLPVIVESGIERREHIETFMERGVSGFLIGTSLIVSGDPCKKLKELCGKL